MEPVKLERNPQDDIMYDLSIEQKFNGNIEFGDPGITIASHVKFNSEDTAVVRYFTGRMSKNISGQFMLFDVPHAAVGTFQTVDAKHSLKRTPKGVILLQQTGISRSAYPYTLTNELLGMLCNSDSINYWNSSYFRLKFVKILGGTDPSRVLALVI